MSFANLRISRKLGIAFAAIVATIVVMSATIFWNLVQLERAQEAEADATRSLELVTSAQWRLTRQENSLRGYLLTGDAYYLDRLRAHREAFDGYLAQLRDAQGADANAAEVLGLIGQASAAMDVWQSRAADEAVRLHGEEATRAQAVRMFGQNGQADALIDPIEAALEAIQESEHAEAAGATALRDSAEALTETVLYAGVAFAVLIAIVLGFLLSRLIASPVGALTATMRRLASGDNAVEVPAVGRKDEIGEMARAVLVFKEAAIEKIRLEGETEQARSTTEAERTRNEAERNRIAEEDHVAITALADGLAALANGDLTFRISVPFAEKTQKLKDDFNITAGQLQDTMATITSAIEGMRSGTGEISQAADDLSRRTEQQAASLEETAAALDEITATVKTTAEGAHRASEVTGQARVGAEKSGEVVRQAVAAMAQIEKSSQQIGQIIGVIDEIAFQTNLLALNAGVEAARAGEAGKGFAVVASEVRALAQRSAEAAKEIKALISTSTQQVDQGVDLVGQTGTALEKIVAQVAEITGLVTEIAASAREQSTGLGEVNSAVNQMDQVTQQNAAMVEQSTAASHNLAQEAEELARLVGKFRLGTQAEAGRKPAPAAPRSRHQPSEARPVAALRTVSAGGAAAALLARQPVAEGWEEF